MEAEINPSAGRTHPWRDVMAARGKSNESYEVAEKNPKLNELPGTAQVRERACYPPIQLEKPEEKREERKPDPDPQWDNLVAALRRNRRQLLRLPGVTAVDIGYKIRNGVFTNELALRVHVESKLDDDYFAHRPNEYVSASRTIKGRPPKEFCGIGKQTVPVDVIEAGYLITAPLPRPSTVVETPLRNVNRRRRIDPLVGGISIGSPRASVGTLGALVWDTTDGSICILSNWHVLAGHMHAERGTHCFQPGPFDRGGPNDVVARLKRWSFDSQTDAAIAELTGSRHYCAGEILSLFQQISGVAPPYLGMTVQKSGRSTEYTRGFIDGLYFSSAIKYSNGIVQVFEDQIHIAPLPPYYRLSEPGDSGAVWVTETNSEGYKAVGLQFAGDLLRSAFGEYALANPMNVVADRLEISFRPVFLVIRDEDLNTLAPTSRIELEGNDTQPTGVSGGLTGSGGQTGDQAQVGPPGR
jgi:hypothetical protein